MKILLLCLCLSACSFSPHYVQDTSNIDRSKLPDSNLETHIANLSACTDTQDKNISIDTQSPITVLVHGCKGSAGRFRSLATLYAFHGQQAVCFSYDDRDSLVDSADKLRRAVDTLATKSEQSKITVLGHSMGGLIARKALEASPSTKIDHTQLELVTVSAPFSGIASANHCGIRPLHWLSIGIVPSICWAITGDNWFEITASSEFIRQPQLLMPSVKRYLKVVTNEKGACRKINSAGECIESDDVFDLKEQYQANIDNYPNVIGVEVEAGHVGIVGNEDIVPRKLLSILQEHNILAETPANKKQALELLLSDLY